MHEKKLTIGIARLMQKSLKAEETSKKTLTENKDKCSCDNATKFNKMPMSHLPTL